MYDQRVTIAEAVKNIQKEDYLLPAIQREIVWEREQITDLFDSVLQGYPIGTFLFWDIDDQNREEYKMYGFIKDYITPRSILRRKPRRGTPSFSRTVQATSNSSSTDNSVSPRFTSVSRGRTRINSRTAGTGTRTRGRIRSYTSTSRPTLTSYWMPTAIASLGTNFHSSRKASTMDGW